VYIGLKAAQFQQQQTGISPHTTAAATTTTTMMMTTMMTSYYISKRKQSDYIQHFGITVPIASHLLNAQPNLNPPSPKQHLQRCRCLLLTAVTSIFMAVATMMTTTLFKCSARYRQHDAYYDGSKNSSPSSITD